MMRILVQLEQTPVVGQSVAARAHPGSNILRTKTEHVGQCFNYSGLFITNSVTQDNKLKHHHRVHTATGSDPVLCVSRIVYN